MSAVPANESHILQNGHQTIAVLVGSMSSEYQEGILRGAAHVAEQKGYNIIGFCGGAINSIVPLSLEREKVFDLVDMDLIAGVISPFSSHMRFLNTQDSQSFIQRFASVPLVNIGSQIDGYSNVVTDYQSGFEALFEHFYHDHGYRNILLIRGPKHHTSSEARTLIYKKLLQKYNIPFDQDKVIYSDLNRSTTKADIQHFFDKVNKPIDAIITVNDNQALGVFDVCKERGINIPQDLAVAGSMNTLEGAFVTPALTTIQEPIFEIGKEAAIELIAQIEGKKTPTRIDIPTALIVRQSCGCKVSTGLNLLAEKTTEELPTSLVDPTFTEMELYIGQLSNKYKGGILSASIKQLLTLYQQSIVTKEFKSDIPHRF